MPLFGPAHPSPIRIKCNTVDGFLLAYENNSKIKNVQPFPIVQKYVRKALKRGKSKSKPVKLWKLKLKNSDITGNQLTALAETLVSHPVIAHLDLRNNFIGDKGAVVILQTMRCQYDAAMHDTGSDHVPGSHIVSQADCNILHKVELEGSGVNMQDESTLLNNIEEHVRVMEDVHRWIELKYVFLKYAEHIEGKGKLLHSKCLKMVIKDLSLSRSTHDKAKNSCENGHMDLELFRTTVAPDFLICGGNRPPLLPRLETRRFSRATQDMIYGYNAQKDRENPTSVTPMHYEKMSNNMKQATREQNEHTSNNNGINHTTNTDGDGANNGHSNGQWGNVLGEDPNRGTNGLTVDLGGDSMDQKMKDSEPKVEAPSPWSSSFSSFESSLATAPRERKHSMTRSSFYAGNASGGGLSRKSSWHKIKKKHVEGALTLNTATGTKTKKGQDDVPGSNTSISSPALKKARIMKSDDEHKIHTMDIGKNSPQKLTPEEQEELDLAEAMKRSLSNDSDSNNSYPKLHSIEEQNRLSEVNDNAFTINNESQQDQSRNDYQRNQSNAVQSEHITSATTNDNQGDMEENNDGNESARQQENIGDENSTREGDHSVFIEDEEMNESETKSAVSNKFNEGEEEDCGDETDKVEDIDNEWHGVLRFNNRRITVLKGVGIDWTYLGTKMHTLDLSNNKLQSIGVSYVGSAGKLIDTTFPSMPLLKKLNLSKNQITHLESLAFHLLPSILAIDLSYNKITQIQGFEANLQLETLNLENNYIRVVEGIGQLENLKSLNISNNRISTVVNLRPLSLNVGLRNLHLQGNPVSFLGRYRPSLISFVPHLDHIDDVPLPPSSAQKAARRVAQKLHDSHVLLLKSRKKQTTPRSHRPITTPEKIGNRYFESSGRKISSTTPRSTSRTKGKNTRSTSKKYKSEEKEEEAINVTKKIIDLEEELKLLVFERKEGDKRRGEVSSTSSSATNLLSTTMQLVRADAYKERSAHLSNSGIVPSGLKKKAQAVDVHKQEAWVEKMSKPKVSKEKSKGTQKYYGFGAYPIPKNFSPANSIPKSGSKMSDKIASALKVDTMVGEEIGMVTQNNSTKFGNAATKSPAVPKVTLRLTQLSTPRAYSSRQKSKHQKSNDRPAWGSGSTQRKKQASMYEKQRQKSAGKSKQKNKFASNFDKSARSGWHTPPISKDMVRSFRREFKGSQNKNESPALERYSKHQGEILATAEQNGVVEDVISVGNTKDDMSSRLQNNNNEYPEDMNAGDREASVLQLIQATEGDTWLNPEQVKTLHNIYNESSSVKQSGKMTKEEIVSTMKSEEELAAVAYLPMKTGYVNSDDVEEWTTLFDAFVEIEESDHDSFVWGELLYFFTARYIENKAHGRTHTIRKILKSDNGNNGTTNGGKTMMRARFSRPTLERRATYTTEDPLALTRMRQWIHGAEQDLASTLSALEMLLRMYEAGDYNSTSIRNYRHRLVDLEIFEVHGPTSLVRTSMENLEDSNPEIVDDIRNVTMRLRDVKAAVKDLLEVMEKFEVGSKEVDEHVRNLMQSIVGRQLAQRKAGEDVSSQLSNDKNGEDTYQYDSVSVASSLWSLEAQASVKNMRVSQNNLPNNNSIDENDAGDNGDRSNSKNNNNDNNASSKPGNNNNYESSVASDTLSDKSNGKLESRPILLEHEVLHLHVNGAANLKKVDTFGHSDPYCVVYSNAEKIGKTGVRKNTATPQWNEVFNISDPLFDLKFDVFDWDRVGSHDYHGRVVLNRADIPMYLGRHNVAFELEADPSKSVKKNKNVGGTLFVSFSVMNDEKVRKANVAEMAANVARKHSKSGMVDEEIKEQQPSNTNTLQKATPAPCQQKTIDISQSTPSINTKDDNRQDTVVENKEIVHKTASKPAVNTVHLETTSKILQETDKLSGKDMLLHGVTESYESRQNIIKINADSSMTETSIACVSDTVVASKTNSMEPSVLINKLQSDMNAKELTKKKTSSSEPPIEKLDRILLQKGFSKLSIHATRSIENKKKNEVAFASVTSINGGASSANDLTLKDDSAKNTSTSNSSSVDEKLTTTTDGSFKTSDLSSHDREGSLSKAIRSSMFSNVSDDVNTARPNIDSSENNSLSLEERIASMLNSGGNAISSTTNDDTSFGDDDDVQGLLQ